MLREVQRLLRREIPDGDPGAIFERALPLLRKDVGRKKLGETSRPRRARGGSRTTSTLPTTTADGRYIPADVRRLIFGPYGTSVVREGLEPSNWNVGASRRFVSVAPC